MPDLLTHGAVATLVKAGTRGPMPAVFVLGTLLPDLCSRVPAISMGYIHVHIVPLPDVLTHGWQPMHQPVGLVLLAYVVTMMFPERMRRTVFGNVLGGMAVHMALDLLQDHHGAGYLIGFPFWTGTFELGWMGSEATVWWALPLTALAAVVIRYRKNP